MHGDIKQGNIFMTVPNDEVHRQYPRIMLADFGVAYTLGGPVTAVQYYRSRLEYGTNGYIAPEIVDHTPEQQKRRRMPHELHGPHSDIYSLGMTCKNLLGLVALHRPTSMSHIRSQSGPQQGSHRQSLDSIYSPKLRELLDRCTARDPRNRPKTYRLYLEAKAQMELHRDIAYAETEIARNKGANTKLFHSFVLYNKDDQMQYETDAVFREEFNKINLQFLWALFEEQEAQKQRPNHRSHSLFRGEKSKSKSNLQIFCQEMKERILR